MTSSTTTTSTECHRGKWPFYVLSNEIWIYIYGLIFQTDGLHQELSPRDKLLQMRQLIVKGVLESERSYLTILDLLINVSSSGRSCSYPSMFQIWRFSTFAKICFTGFFPQARNDKVLALFFLPVLRISMIDRLYRRENKKKMLFILLEMSFL